MLDFNRHYHDEICGSGPLPFTTLDTKPGKKDTSPACLGWPTTYTVTNSNCDEKRIGPCVTKGATKASGNQ